MFVNKPKAQPIVEGITKCMNRGCLKEYNLEENHDAACTFHSGNPIFHDVSKSWSCCPDRVAYDFDEFMEIQGCCVGPHRNVATRWIFCLKWKLLERGKKIELINKHL